jgi:subtilisin family serine protease
MTFWICLTPPCPAWAKSHDNPSSPSWESFRVKSWFGVDHVDVRPRELLVCIKGSTAQWARTRLDTSAGYDWEPLIPKGTSNPLGQRSNYQGQNHSLDQWLILKLPRETSLEYLMHQLRMDPEVTAMEPNYRIELHQANPEVFLPDDFYFDRSWGLHNTGQFEGKVDADIDLPEAWALGKGSKQVRVAVIDTGIDFFHPDIRDNLWINHGEIPGNGIDDDQNGFIDDLHGFDFVSNDGDPFDDQSHGTHVAGIIGAIANNQKGSTGVAQRVSMMAIKTFGRSGTADVATVARGVRYAIDQGAHILNASWGVDVRSEVMRITVEEAAQAEVLFVAAGGNRQSSQLFYPAAFDDTIGVGATDREDKRTRFSNFGSFIDLAAPGQTIFSTMPDNRFGFLSGTSMAAPHVSGTAVLLLARHPEWTSTDLTRIILNSVDPIQIQPGKPLGSGRLNVRKAQQVVEQLPRAEILLPDKIGGIVDIGGFADGERFQGYTMDVGKGASPSQWKGLFQSSRMVSGTPLLLDFNTEALMDGLHTFRLRVIDQLNQTNMVKKTVEVANVAISLPQNNDVIRAGALVDITGSVYGKSRTYIVEYGHGVSPTTWSSSGIKLSDHARQQPFQSLLATWDTRSVKPDRLYSIRLTSKDAEGNTEMETVKAIHLEQSLKPGFPIRSTVDRTRPEEDARPLIGGDLTADDWRPLVVEDLDQDGDREIVVVEIGDLFGAPTYLCVYTHDGDLLWKKNLGASVPFHDLPLIGDIDGDGFSEIFTEGASGGFLRGFHHDGQPLTQGWPVDTGAKSLGKVMADLDGNDTMEIIALTHDSPNGSMTTRRDLVVIQADGNISHTWQLHACQHELDVMELLPAIGNMDEDPAMEIVCVNDCNSVGIYDLDDPNGAKETAFASGGKLITSPVIGDLDRDGQNEIIVVSDGSEDDSPAGIHVFDRQGEILSGFPVLVEEHFDNAPALADLDGDQDLEIIVSNHRSGLIHAIHHHGFPLEGWPVGPVRDGLIRATPLIGDLNGDTVLDILIPAYGTPLTLLIHGGVSHTSGLRAWNQHGIPVRLGTGNGKDRLWMEFSAGSVIKTAPPVLADLEGDGWLDVIASTTLDLAYSRDNPRIRLKNTHSIYAWSLETPNRADLLPWPTYQKDNDRSGRFDETIHINQGPGIRPILNQTIPQGSRFFPVNLNRYGFDPDHDRNELIWSVQGNGILILKIDESNILTATLPSADWLGEETITVILRDPEGASANLQVNLRSLKHYTPPVANPDKAETLEDTPITIPVVLNDTHPGLLSFRILNVTPPLNGQATLTEEGEVIYAPKENFHGEDSFQYVIVDIEDGMSIGNVNLRVNPVNDPPLAEEDRIIVTEDTSISFDPLANDSDPDGDAIHLVAWTQPIHGKMERLDSGGFLYNPNRDYSGSDTFTYVLEDSAGARGKGEGTLLVKGVNDTPMAVSQQLELNRHREQNIIFTAKDPDGDPLTYEIVEGPKHGKLMAFPQVATYIPEFGFSGTDHFTFRANDGKMYGPAATVALVINDKNNPPDIDNLQVVTAVNQQVTIPLEAVDVDEDSFDFSINSPPLHGTLTHNGDTLLYEPSRNFLGNDEVIIRVMDTFGHTASATINIEVTDQNTAPEARDIAVEIFGNKTESFELGVEDRENNPLKYEWVSLPEHGTLLGEPPTMSYHPDPEFFGFDRIQFIASDGEFESNLGTVVIEVQYPNHPPEGDNQTVRVQMNRAKTFNLSVNDMDDDTLQRVILEGPKHGIISGLEDSLTYQPNTGFVGSDDFTWRVWDGFKYNKTRKANIKVSRFDPDFRLKIESIGMVANQQLSIIVHSEPGRRYTLQRSMDLVTWVDVATQTAHADSITFLEAFELHEAYYFYRAALSP